MSINMFLIAAYRRERAKQFKQVALLERGVWEKTVCTEPPQPVLLQDGFLPVDKARRGGAIWVQVQPKLFCLPVKISVAYQGQGGFSF